jgi:hypothetical protein
MTNYKVQQAMFLKDTDVPAIYVKTPYSSMNKGVITRQSKVLSKLLTRNHYD